MENNTNQGNTASQNTENRDNTPRDWWAEREKWREERHKWRSDMRAARFRWPFHGLFPGLTLILFGVLFLLNQTGAVTGDAWWQSMLIGLGAIMILDGIVRYFSKSFRWGIFGKFIGGLVLIAFGTLFLTGISSWWPVVLIGAGAAFVLRPFWRRFNMLP